MPNFLRSRANTYRIMAIAYDNIDYVCKKLHLFTINGDLEGDSEWAKQVEKFPERYRLQRSGSILLKYKQFVIAALRVNYDGSYFAVIIDNGVNHNMSPGELHTRCERAIKLLTLGK